MSVETLSVDLAEQEDRYSRLRLISWWDQEKIRAARVLVVGAGALGNEILKNLALLGFVNVVVVDFDRIEVSNLSRAVLFRADDVGRAKAEAVAGAYRELLPEAKILPLNANLMRDCGLGLFAWANVILAGLDNREARLFLNRAAWKVGRPWIDGAIEGVNGVARVFLPGTPPCYECTLGEVDWAILGQRLSCNLLLHEPNRQGRVPTTPTISSIIAGVQVQEAVKLLHQLPAIAGKGYFFEGMHHASSLVEYTENPDCLSHHTFERVVQLPWRSSEVCLDDLLERARMDLGSNEVTIEFSRDIVQKLVCPACGDEEAKYLGLGTLTVADGRCARDGSVRAVHSLSSFTGELELGVRRLSQLGLPLFDVYTARSPLEEIAYCLAGDAPLVLGALATVGGPS